MNQPILFYKLIFSLTFLALSLFAQNKKKMSLKEQYSQISNQFEILQGQYWEKKEEIVKEKKMINEELQLLNEHLKMSYDKKNNLTEEFYLVKQNLEELKEKKEEVANNQNSFLNLLKETLKKEKKKIKSLFPYLLEPSILKISKIENNLEKKNNKVIFDLFNYKQDLLKESEILTIGSKVINPKKNKKLESLLDSRYLRLGFIHQSYTGNKEAGLLVKNTDLKGIYYKWEVELPTDLKRNLSTAINQSFNQAGNDKKILIPIDITQAGKKLRSLTKSDSSGLINKMTSFFNAGGLIMYPLFLIAIVAIGIIIERMIFYINDNKKNKIILSKIFNLIKDRLFNQAKKLCLENQSCAANIIIPLLEPKTSRENTENLLGESFSKEIPKLQKYLPTLAVLSAIAPLLGLLGTVSGMITLFDVITIYGTSNPKILAGGISIALITTQTGLAIAIPIMLFHHYLTRFKTSTVNKIEELSLQILNKFYPK